MTCHFNLVPIRRKQERFQQPEKATALLGIFAVIFHKEDVCHWEAFGQICTDIVLGVTIAFSAHTAKCIEQQIADVSGSKRTSGGKSWRWTLVPMSRFFTHFQPWGEILQFSIRLFSAALCDKMFSHVGLGPNVCSGFAGLRKQRIVLIVFYCSQRREKHLNEHFPFSRDRLLPGIRRPGFIEHFYVPLWVSVVKTHQYLQFLKQAFTTGSRFFPGVFCLFLESSSLHETDQKEKSQIEISSGWRRFLVSS